MNTIKSPALGGADEASGRDGALLDAKTVATLRQLKLVGRLYTAFVAALPGQLMTLREAMAARDRATIRWHAHRLRGASGQLGATALARVFGEIECAAESGEEAELSRADAELDEVVRATTDALMRAVEGAG